MFGGGFFGGGAGFFEGGGRVPGRFDHQYQAFPVSFIGKEELEKGNKLILPQSALDHLARLNISYPMLFEISNPGLARRTHGGVQEFIAEEGTCYLPYWMMQNLLLKEGDLIRVTNTSLQKGTFVKLQPVKSDFLDIHNPRAVLENSLRNFATLTVGDSIVINYNQKSYEIEVVECRPTQAISIIEADVNVDFAPPKDYQEQERPVAASSSTFKAKVEESEEPAPPPRETGPKVFGGQGQRVDGKPIKATPQGSPALGPQPPPVDLNAETPWKNRLIRGVKMTQPPPGVAGGHMTGRKAGGAIPTLIGDKDMYAGTGNTLQ